MPSQSLHIQALQQCISSSLQGAGAALMHKQRVIVSTEDEATSMAFHPPIAAEMLLRTLEQCRL
ncbi:hypothetical protein KBB08_04240 [Candidatus Gracilibacteria bacterium]|nr:hypothetical protein [Candidatus Gracilibacteria bacterium]